MKFKIALLSGDGIGPEVTEESLKILDGISKKYGHEFEFDYQDVGGISIDKHGTAITEEALSKCMESQAVLFGSVGGPKWDDPNSDVKPYYEYNQWGGPSYDNMVDELDRLSTENDD